MTDNTDIKSPFDFLTPPAAPELITVQHNNKTYRILFEKNYYWFVAREWMPALHYENYQDRVKKINRSHKKVYYLPINKNATNNQPKHVTIRHDKFLRMLKWNNRPKAQNFKQWTIDEVIPMLYPKGPKAKKQDLEKSFTGENPLKTPYQEKYGKQLTLYFVEREEWLQDIDATPSEDATNWLPGVSIKTTTKKDRNKVLEVIKMGYIQPEQFIYIEYYPIIPVQHIYSYKADGSLEKFTQVNELINKEATKE